MLPFYIRIIDFILVHVFPPFVVQNFVFGTIIPLIIILVKDKSVLYYSIYILPIFLFPN